MTKQEFMSELREGLSRLPKSEVDEILRDQDEYISDAMRAGRSEAEAVASLGSPSAFATTLLAESRIQRAEGSATLKTQTSHTLSALMAIVALAPLNLIFVLGPFVGTAGAILGVWGAAAGILAGGLALTFIFFTHLIFVSAGFWTHLSTFLFALGCVGAGLLAFLFMETIARGFLRLTVRYLKWNLKLIKASA